VFMSPEVIMEQRYSRKSDVWSLGCTVIQMATGNPPYSEHSNHIAALFAITNSSEPPPIPDKLSDEARQFLLRCFARDPAERASVEDLLLTPFVSTNTNKSSFDRDEARVSPTSTMLANAGGEAATGQLKAASTEQDETKAWETWKERQWKTASKTVVRLKRGHVLERRKGGYCPHASQPPILNSFSTHSHAHITLTSLMPETPPASLTTRR
jgi:serine/threonine protein kinase